jgi:hypothetical protein
MFSAEVETVSVRKQVQTRTPAAGMVNPPEYKGKPVFQYQTEGAKLRYCGLP